MEKNIIDLLQKYNFDYVPIPKESLENIHELLVNNKEFEPTTDIDMLYIGVFWRIKDDPNKMVKYFLLASDHKNSTAMNNLAYYYGEIRKYDDSVRYYLMAIENGNVLAMGNLAKYYNEISELDNAVKYYLMAIENGHANSMNNLAFYYEKISKYDHAVKYYLMAIESGNVVSMVNLACYYVRVSKFDDAIKYYLMAIDNGNVDAMDALAYYYQTKSNFTSAVEYYLMAIKYGSKISYERLTKYYLDVCDIFDEHFLVYLKFEQCELVNIFRSIKNMYDDIMNVLVSHFEYSPGTDKFREVEREFKKHKFM